MFGSWAASFFSGGSGGGDADDDNKTASGARDAQRTYDAALRQYIAVQFRERAPDFFEDDVETGRHVIDATFRLADALAERRRRFVDDGSRHRTLADALVSAVLAHEGAHESRRERAWMDMTLPSQRSAVSLPLLPLAMLPPPPPPPPRALESTAVSLNTLDALYEHVIAAWCAVFVENTAGLGCVLITGRSSHNVPRSVFQGWTKNAAAANARHPVLNDADASTAMHMYDVTYTVDEDEYNGDDGDDDDDAQQRRAADINTVVARQALAPLKSALDVLRTEYDAQCLRVDCMLNVQLHGECAPNTLLLDDADVHNITMATCAVAYRVYARPRQRPSGFTASTQLEDDDNTAATPSPPPPPVN